MTKHRLLLYWAAALAFLAFTVLALNNTHTRVALSGATGMAILITVLLIQYLGGGTHKR